jgi:cytoskeletal protein RodZ
MDDRLMLGILLIIVGIAIGLIAVAVVLNRREDRIAADTGLESNDTDDQRPSDSEEEDPAPEVDEDEPAPEADEDEPAPEADDDEPSEDSDEIVEAEEIDSPTPRERQLVAEIYREEVTGKLIVRASGQEYLAAKQIENEAERRRLAYAASDLSDWFQGEYEFGGRSATSISTQQSASSDQMLEEINAILQRSLAGTPDRGIRLVPDPVAGVKVLIGVKSYEIEEVPDDEIKDLIRQAVAEWEAGQ